MLSIQRFRGNKPNYPLHQWKRAAQQLSSSWTASSTKKPTPCKTSRKKRPKSNITEAQSGLKDGVLHLENPFPYKRVYP